jgi:hypothetical protein
MSKSNFLFLSLSLLLSATACSSDHGDPGGNSESTDAETSADSDSSSETSGTDDDGDSGDGDGDGSTGDGDGDGSTGDGDGDGSTGDGDGDGSTGDGDGDGDGSTGDGDGDGDGDGSTGDGDGDGEASCMGTPSSAVEQLCAGLGTGMACDPTMGCRESGECLPKLTQQDCLLRSLDECGSGIALGVCRVELAEPIQNSICVLTDAAALCDQSNLLLQGSCLSFTGESNVDNICVWENGGSPVCQAMECEGAPVEQFCNFIDGCEWTN